MRWAKPGVGVYLDFFIAGITHINTDSIFFSIWVLFHEHSRITGLQRKGEGIPLTPLYSFHPLHRHLDISRAITAENSALHIASSQTRTGNLWLPRDFLQISEKKLKNHKMTEECFRHAENVYLYNKNNK